MVRFCGELPPFAELVNSRFPCDHQLALQVHYPGDTYRAINDAKRVSKVAAWLKNAEINLGPVDLPDGTTQERVIEPWVIKKQVTAYNPRQAALEPASKVPQRAGCTGVAES